MALLRRRLTFLLPPTLLRNMELWALQSQFVGRHPSIGKHLVFIKFTNSAKVAGRSGLRCLLDQK